MTRISVTRLGVVGLLAAVTARAGDIDPAGVYYHTFTGAFSGSEWLHVAAEGGGDPNPMKSGSISNAAP